jgi:3-oxoacyl-[acyl-carrier protein] reductase
VTRHAVVTGASGGIGSVIAQSLAAEGLTVTVGYHSAREKADAIVASLAGEGHEAWPISVLETASLDALAAHITDRRGKLDVLVNCAGVTKPLPHDDLDGLDDELIDRIFATNVRGPFATIRSLRPALEAADDPVIVNISSVSAVTGQGSNVAYCASKAALDSMARSLARALGPKIRIVSVSPGWVRGEYAARMPQEILAVQENATPLARLATPKDVGDAVVAVVSHLPFTTGAIISVDGGRPLGTT